MRRTLTPRQLAILEFITERKRAGAESITLDEISDRIKSKGIYAHRNSLIISMNGIIQNMRKFGIYIEKHQQMGRGAKQVYKIRRAY